MATLASEGGREGRPRFIPKNIYISDWKQWVSAAPRMPPRKELQLVISIIIVYPPDGILQGLEEWCVRPGFFLFPAEQLA